MTKKKQKTKKKQSNATDEEEALLDFDLKHETKKSILAIVFFVVAIFLILSSVGLAGTAGNFIHDKVLLKLFGYGFVLVLTLLVIVGLLHIRNVLRRFGVRHWIAVVLLLVGALGFLELVFPNTSGNAVHAGGYIGLVARPVEQLFGIYFSVILFSAVTLIGLLLMLEARLTIPSFIRNLPSVFTKNDDDEDEEDIEETLESTDSATETKETHSSTPEETTEKPNKEESTPTVNMFSGNAKKQSEGNSEAQELGIKDDDKRPPSAYTPPPLSLLSKQNTKPGVGDIKTNTTTIKRTLKNFGIDVEMDEVSVGPTVTRYSLKPAQGVKLTRIVSLQNELALALAAHPVRIEAPIPGTSLVGIEVPNDTKATVGLRTLMKEDKFQQSADPLLAALGKTVSGESRFTNINKLPHLLIAGATGAGKSVTVHTIIASLLYRNGPQDMRIIMVDPKRVELTLYNSIPHLLTPVIKDPKKAIMALKWATKEMERRYDILENEAVRDISSYHESVVQPAYEKHKENSDNEDDVNLPERMPYIVIIIDELADIMQTYPRELEAAIVRLAQMSRAVGIHLILSTQRPSVNVITGLIKANIPARIALKVSSQVDSRTILDTGGAEKLIGAGDMLFSSGEMAKPERIQSSFIAESEVKKVTNHLKKQHEGEIPDEISLDTEDTSDNAIFSASMDDDEEEDDLYDEAQKIVIEAGKASTSFIQRKLRVGYSRAARLMDMLEERGVVGPQEGSKPREVIAQSDAATNTSEHEESNTDTELREHESESSNTEEATGEIEESKHS